MTDVTAGRREQTKAVNRQAILDAATEVFGDIGYGAATVRDIVRGTDLATGTFYNYFPDKEAVLRAILDDWTLEARVLIRESRRRSSSVEEFVEFGFRAYYEYLVGDRPTFELLRRNAGTIRALFDEPVFAGGTEELLEDLRAGISAGLLPDIDPEYLAGAMFGAGFEVALLMLDRTPPDVDGAVAFITELFLGGMLRLRQRNS